jgi:aminoglycoside phosphotransferase family enzyme
MTREQIDKIVLRGDSKKTELIETHISWVVLGERFVYKIKKPIRYSFLDFSTLEKRKYYCEREIQLNRRLTDDMYLDVQPVKERAGRLFIGNEHGEIIDYAVSMRKLDRSMQMDILLMNNKVTSGDIQKLAQKIASFHKTARVIFKKNLDSLRKEFNDLKNEKEYLSEYLPPSTGMTIDQAVGASDRFIEEKRYLLDDRIKKGFFRDCHGDLHSRNIFLTPDPQPFDCIEFNDDFRAIDILNEVAFLCMDLDAFGRRDLSELFLSCYNNLLPAIQTREDYRLFIYYKMYRANIRAKVNSLRARSADNDAVRRQPLTEAEKYLELMTGYIKILDMQNLTWKLSGIN